MSDDDDMPVNHEAAQRAAEQIDDILTQEKLSARDCIMVLTEEIAFVVAKSLHCPSCGVIHNDERTKPIIDNLFQRMRKHFDYSLANYANHESEEQEPVPDSIVRH